MIQNKATDELQISHLLDRYAKIDLAKQSFDLGKAAVPLT